jgi:hypothetical protein
MYRKYGRYVIQYRELLLFIYLMITSVLYHLTQSFLVHNSLTDHIQCFITCLGYMFWPLEGHYQATYIHILTKLLLCTCLKYVYMWSDSIARIYLLAAFLDYSIALKMEAVFSSESSIDLYQTAHHHIPENSTLYTHCCENLQFNVMCPVLICVGCTKLW